MNTKVLGRTGLEVSEIGLGARWLTTKDKPYEEIEKVYNTLKLALEAGIDHIDTAAGYGDSERVIGEVLKETGAQVTLSTKTWSGKEEKIRESLVNSLILLNREYVDVYLIHNPEQTFNVLPVYQKLKEEGLIKAIGVCGWHGDEDLMKKAIEDGRADVLQIAVTIAHRGMLEKGVIDLAHKHNLGIQVMGPLEKGNLSGHEELVKPLYEFNIRNLEQAAIKYLIDHIRTGIPIPGTSKPERIEELVSVADQPEIPEDKWLEVIQEIDKVPEFQEVP